jgi:hypothetical protein
VKRPPLRYVVVASLLGGGCASVDVVPAERFAGRRFVEGAEPIAHIRASNWGWYLFKFIPIWTGNLNRPRYPQLCRWFDDNVTVDDVVGVVMAKGEELGGNVISDLQTTDKSGWQAATIFFWLNEIEVSANVSKK